MAIDMFKAFETQVARLIADYGVAKEEILLLRPPKKEFGDLSSAISFELASKGGKNPREIAQEIANGLDPSKHDLIGQAVVAGAGYVNFYINTRNYNPRTLQAIQELGDHYGDLELGAAKGKTIIEHTSVNPNKPWHIGHARNAILGDAMSRLFRKAGYVVEVENYIDDTGTQVAETIFATDYFQTLPPEGVKFDHFAGNEYVRLHRVLEDSSTPAEAQEEIKKGIERVMRELEEGVHRPFVEHCLDGQFETAWRLKVFYDLLIWESDIVRAKLLEEAMGRIKESKYVYVAQEGHAKGCLMIEMGDFLGHSGEQSEEHPVDKILIRSNGIATYTAKDIALQMWKFGLLARDMTYARRNVQPNGHELWTTHPEGERLERPPAEGVINVIGFEQQYPQQVVAAALKILGYDRQYENFHHLPYGHVWLPEGRMSGRKGIGASADEVLEEVIAEARRVVQEKRGDELPPQEMAQIAEAVGIGAFRFAMLRKNPLSQVSFQPDEVVNFAGYTAPYLQYAYARIGSILRKLQEENTGVDLGVEPPDLAILDSPKEKQLVLHLALLPSTVKSAADELNPGLICQYGYDLAQSFAVFYDNCPVLKAPGDLRRARLELIKCTATVLQIVMNLIGIPILERL